MLEMVLKWPLVLPAIVQTSEEHHDIADGTVYLATVWSQVERSDGRCRYFNGTVIRKEVEFEDISASPGVLCRGDAVCFDFENDQEIELQIAGERLRRFILNSFMKLSSDTALIANVMKANPASATQCAYVSVEEALAALVLSQMVFTPIGQIKRLFGGLALVEWLRGYAVVQQLAREHMQRSECADGVDLVTEGEVLKALTDHGLPEDRASVFLRHVTFGRNVDDIFDAPFIRCQDGRMCFIVGAAAYANPASVVVSQLSSLRCDMSWKGQAFEADILNLFQTHRIEAAAIHRKIGGKELEIDCVALWDGILYVFEAKNYFLPADNPQTKFWFLQDQRDAARQVLEKVRAIEAHPDIVSDALGKNVTWNRIVPVVLNGAPFSLPGPIDDVYFYDASALHRFLEDGFLGYSIVLGGTEAARSVDVCRQQLWSGEKPCAVDLLRQLQQPSQVMQALPLFQREKRVAPISRTLYIETFVLDRLETTPERLATSIGVEEQDCLDDMFS